MNLLPSAPGSYVDISVYKPDLEYFLEKFRNNEHFAFARYQDQWWASVARALQQCQNYKPHVVSEAFSKHYHNTNYKITSDVSLENFWLLSQSRPVFVIGVKCMEKKFSKHIPKLTQDTEFLYAHCWRQISRRGDIVKMFEEFKNENFIVIGPHYLKKSRI